MNNSNTPLAHFSLVKSWVCDVRSARRNNSSHGAATYRRSWSSSTIQEVNIDWKSESLQSFVFHPDSLVTSARKSVWDQVEKLRTKIAVAGEELIRSHWVIENLTPSTSIWFQVVPYCWFKFLFSLSDDFLCRTWFKVYIYMGRTWSGWKKHFWVAKCWFWGGECKF